MSPNDLISPAWLWFGGVTANLLAAFLFATLGTVVLRNLHRTGQWSDNPLGRATGAVFLAAGVSHLAHAAFFMIHGADLFVLMAAVLVDNLAVLSLLTYLAHRRRHGRSNAMYEDLHERRRALEINDAVVQRLTEAKLALDLGNMEMAYEALGSSLEQSKRICNDMLSHAPGSLRMARGGP